MKHLRIIALLLLAGCSSVPRTSESLAQSDLIVTNIETAPIEYQLVYLDAGQLPRGNDTRAARIRYLLKTLSEKTGDSMQAIADRTQRSTSVLKSDYGKVVTNQQFLEGASNSAIKGKYADLAAAMVITLGR